MSILDRIRNLFFKQSEARQLVAVHQLGQVQSTPVNYEAAANEGYRKSVTVFRAINLVANSAAGIDWELYRKSRGDKQEVLEHPLLDLLQKPNPMQGGAAFMKALIGFNRISGNAYIEAVGNKSGPPRELWPLRPDRVKIMPGRYGLPAAFVYEYRGTKKTWQVDPITGQGPILHIKTFNPTNDWYGLSPLEAAFIDVQQNSGAKKYNLALLHNSATPSGIMKVLSSEYNPGGKLTTEEYERLKDQIEDQYSGVSNGGRPMLLEGGLDWQAIGIAPKQLEMLENKNATARDICQAFDVPPLLLGLPGDNTFSNYKEARAAFYEDTILPLMDFMRDEFNNWLTPKYGDNLYLDYNRDDIEALAPKREAKFSMLKDATFLTENEKRDAAGYAEAEGLDFYVYPSTAQFVGETSLLMVEDETEDELTEEQVDNEEQKSYATLTHEINHIKIFNLLNDDERRRAWVKQNRARGRIVTAFEADLVEDFQKLYEAIRGVKDVGITAIEFAVEKVVEESEKRLTTTLKKHIKRTLVEFGRIAFADAKAQRMVMETKSAFTRFLDFVDVFVSSHTAEAITKIKKTNRDRVVGTVKKLVLDTIEAGDGNQVLADKLEETFSDDNAIKINKSRARVIARTEVQLASSNGIREAVKTLQIPNIVKEWISIQDDRTRQDPQHADHLRMNGEKVPLEEKFTVPPDASMEGPGDPSAPPEQVINCRCVQAFKQVGN